MSTASNSVTGLTAIIPLPPSIPPAAPPLVHQESVLRQVPTSQPYRLSVEQFERMIKEGVLGKYDRCELIRGELIGKMTIGDPHMAAVKRFSRILNKAAADDFLVGVQDAIKLADSRPEPDISVLKYRSDFFEKGTAEPPDILLLAEVSDTTLQFDRTVKLPLYAENNIQEYWIVNLIDDCLEIYRQPQGQEYAQRLVIRRGESVAPLSLPAVSLTAEMLLGPTPAASAG